ncbi:hypothetical protein MKX01_032155 [Papaver californicum]|nr:hypothetical protein MKX01_032155 [Papaver californicum]
MDNILSGSNPSTQSVTGVVGNQVTNDQDPFSKSNGAVPLKNASYRIIENKNLPLHTVVNGTTDSLPFGNRAQLSLHRVIFAWFRFGWKGTRILCNTLSFFGIRNTAVSESQLAIMGGTGKYINAKGFATITAIPSTSHSITDEAKSLLQFSVFLD